eukprot:GFYU01001217.1.p1 GENE.GFYU01001217.1~~GFYU01001217.1.p1  ORF type:complete len:160 (-),score=46.53 GFYU01001217.1:126-536(-)
MPKFLKPGKVVILLNGRQAGKKAVIVKSFDEGVSGGRGYGHCVVAGVKQYPLKVNAGMGKKRLEKRSRVKPFIKVVNYTHIMPTRYGLDVDLKTAVTPEAAADPAQRTEACKSVAKIFTERYKSGKNKWFFTKLRF